MTDTAPLLELRGITKRFPGVVANDGVDLDLQAREVHALLGENGAGKSTLMNVLYGLYHPDAGEILLRGKPVRFRSPREAIAAGIGMVHQHFQLIPVLTVTENIVLGAEPHRGPMMDVRRAEAQVADIARRFGLPVDPRARVEAISVAQQQRVEILKALYRHADLLILDEPTAVLSPQEAEDLAETLRGLAREGMGIIFISHKLNEVLDLADRISVLRLGRKVATVPREGATAETLARMMVGRDVDLSGTRKPGGPPGPPVLSVRGLVVRDNRGLDAVRGVDLDVRAGEIVAIAGVDGNGQTELVEALTGLRHPERGSIRLGGREVAGAQPRRVAASGLGHVPEDRHRHGLVLQFNLAENLILGTHYRTPVSRLGWLHPRVIVDRARRLLKRFDVRGGGPATPAVSLSGGNQQKTVLAREIDRQPEVLLAAQPTRGLDVAAIEFVHQRLREQRDAGRGVLLVSLELDEIMALADRVLVMYEGQVALEAPGGAVTRDELGVAMTGGRSGEEELARPAVAP